MKTRLALVLIVALTSCARWYAPSIPSLVEHHHLREALCARQTSNDADDRLIQDALIRDLDPRVRISDVDLPAIGNESRFRGVQVRVATNAVPVDRLVVSASPASEGVAAGDLHSLATLTSETLPGSRMVGGSGPMTELAIGVLAIASFGILRIEPWKPHVEYPSDAEMERAAPRAWAMSRVLRSDCERPVADGVAIRCTFAFAARDIPSAAIDLELKLEALPPQHDTCSFTKRVRVPLHTTPDFRPLREVAGAP